MNLDILPIGLYQENSYVLHDQGHVLFIDPGRYAKEIMKCVKPEEKADGIILTHGHEDHTGAVDDLAEAYQCPVYMHSADMILTDPKETGRGFDGPVYSKIEPLDTLTKAGSFSIKVYHTPGHTEGSCCIQIKNLLFTGDTLFASDIGRTDLFSGSEEEMMQSLILLKSLPGSLQIYPGHGPASTMAEEKMRNPYLQFGE
jgi:glyoxylase-like metal-dependent hydrolase (beta-lactamase superfamily II)